MAVLGEGCRRRGKRGHDRESQAGGERIAAGRWAFGGIPAEERGDADANEIEEEGGGNPQRSDLGVRRVDPPNRCLGEPIAETAGEEEHFGVEGEAVDALRGEQRAGRLTAEELEAALRVGDIEPEADTGQAARAPTEDAAHRGLLAFVGADVAPGTDHDVGAVDLDGDDELIELSDRRAEVGVGEEHEVAAGGRRRRRARRRPCPGSRPGRAR